MAIENSITPEARTLGFLKQSQGKAVSDLKRTKRLLLALRGLSEDRAEKSIVLAINETTEKAYKAVLEVGSGLKKMEQKLNKEVENGQA